MTTTTGAPVLAVRGLTVGTGRRRRLREVTASLGRGELAALVGVSGAGKTTLLRALAGLVEPAAGSGTAAGRVGYVPQHDALRSELSVGQELGYAARLRCPQLSAAERAARVGHTLARLGVAELADRRIGTLSAGERKRVSVAVELLAAPDVLLLDEATSGIDPAHELSLLRFLRQLADDGCTILLATHSTLALDEFDRVLMLGPDGRLLHAGPPAGALAAAGVRSYAELFDRVEPFGDAPADVAPGPSVRVPRLGFGSQLRVLLARELARLVTDRRLLAFVGLQAPVLGLFVRFLLGTDGLAVGGVAVNLDARRALLTLTLSAVWLGAANAIREIVKDRAVLERDRVAGVGPTAQLLAKVVLLAVVCLAQSVVLLLVGVAGADAPPAPPVGGHWLVALTVTLWLAGTASGCVALAISALVRRTDYALALLPVVLVPQLVLSGGVMPLGDSTPLRTVAAVSTARWGFAMVASSTHLREVETTTVVPVPLSHDDLMVVRHQDADAHWHPTAGTWGADGAALAALALAGAAVAWVGLRRRVS